MEYQSLASQAYWNAKVKSENRMSFLSRIFDGVKTLFLVALCVALMVGAFIGYMTHETWLPTYLAEFESFYSQAPQFTSNKFFSSFSK